MKTLYDYISEEASVAAAALASANATPANTMGMGNPAFPDPSNGMLGSEGVPTAKPKRKRKKKLVRTDEAFKFPMEMFLKALLKPIVDFEVKLVVKDGSFVLTDSNDKFIADLGNRLTRRTLATKIIKG